MKPDAVATTYDYIEAIAGLFSIIGIALLVPFVVG